MRFYRWPLTTACFPAGWLAGRFIGWSCSWIRSRNNKGRTYSLKHIVISKQNKEQLIPLRIAWHNFRHPTGDLQHRTMELWGWQLSALQHDTGSGESQHRRRGLLQREGGQMQAVASVVQLMTEEGFCEDTCGMNWGRQVQTHTVATPGESQCGFKFWTTAQNLLRRFTSLWRL